MRPTWLNLHPAFCGTEKAGEALARVVFAAGGPRPLVIPPEVTGASDVRSKPPFGPMAAHLVEKSATPKESSNQAGNGSLLRTSAPGAPRSTDSLPQSEKSASASTWFVPA